MNLGYKSGNEGVIKVIVTNLRELYTTDSRGTALQDIPMMRGIENIQQMKLIINISAGYPGGQGMGAVRRDALPGQDSPGCREHRRAGASVVSLCSEPAPRPARGDQGSGRV